MIDDLVKPEGYTGPIEVGMKFIWMPETIACEYVTVTKVVDIEWDERRIFTEYGRMNEETWNDESRFREACVRNFEGEQP